MKYIISDRDLFIRQDTEAVSQIDRKRLRAIEAIRPAAATAFSYSMYGRLGAREPAFFACGVADQAFRWTISVVQRAQW